MLVCWSSALDPVMLHILGCILNICPYRTKKGWKNIFETKSQTDFGHKGKVGHYT
jgi:hypothetical protein